VRRIEEVETTAPATGDPSTAVRDYVYGPEYVDELICPVDHAGGTGAPTTWYYLQDANYDVVALTGAGVSAGGQNQPGGGG